MIFFFILLASLLFVPNPIQATTMEVTMVLTSPAEDMSHEINISYHTQLTGTVIELTVASDVTFAQKTVVTPTCFADEFDNLAGNVKSYYRCEVTLTDLTPDTRYMYRVGKETFTNPYYFKTAGGSSFSFLHITDIHSYESIPGRVDAANAVITKAKEMDPNLAFTLASGDVTAYGSYYQQWVNLFDMPMIQEMPFVTTPGNHDYYYYPTSGLATGDNTFYNKVTYNPDNGAPTVMNSTYYFTYNNTLFISIDSEMQAQSSASLADQQAWFEEVVRENRQTFIIVFTHRPFYTGDGLNAGQASDMRIAWQKIFDACGVDLVLTGHNHVYARTTQVHSAFDASETHLGTVYVTGIQLGDRYVTDVGTPMSDVEKAIVGKVDGGSLIKVYSNYIEMSFINTAGETLDWYRIEAKDKFLNKEELIQGIELSRSSKNPEIATLSVAPETIGFVEKIIVRDELDDVILEIPYPKSAKYTIQSFNISDIEYNVTVELYYHDQSMGSSSFIFDNLRYNYGSIVNLRVNLGTSILHWDSRLENNVITKYEIYVNDSLVTTINDLSVEQYQLENLGLFQEHEIYFYAYDEKNQEIYSKRLTYGTSDLWSFMTTTTIEQFESLVYYLRGE